MLLKRAVAVYDKDLSKPWSKLTAVDIKWVMKRKTCRPLAVTGQIEMVIKKERKKSRTKKDKSTKMRPLFLSVHVCICIQPSRRPRNAVQIALSTQRNILRAFGTPESLPQTEASSSLRRGIFHPPFSALKQSPTCKRIHGTLPAWPARERTALASERASHS